MWRKNYYKNLKIAYSIWTRFCFKNEIKCNDLFFVTIVKSHLTMRCGRCQLGISVFPA